MAIKTASAGSARIGAGGGAADGKNAKGPQVYAIQSLGLVSDRFRSLTALILSNEVKL
jgi:hypothetical protein